MFTFLMKLFFSSIASSVHSVIPYIAVRSSCPSNSLPSVCYIITSMCFDTSVTNSKVNNADDLTKSILFMFLINVSKIEISLKRIRIVP